MSVSSVTPPASPVTPPAASSAASSTALAQATSSQQLNQQTFLKLLVTQLTNQDPTAPQDETQTLAQLAQFSTVEGINNLSTSQAQQQATTLLGKTVNATVTQNNTPTPVTGLVTSVKFDASGVHLTLQGVTTPVSIADISQVQ